MLLLPPAAFLLTWFLVHTNRERAGFSSLSRRGTLVLAFVVLEVTVLVVTEVSSVGSHFTRGTVTAAWILVVVVLAVAAWRPARAMVSGAGPGEGLRRSGTAVRQAARRLGVVDRILIGVIVVAFGILVVVGFRYLPNNPDSLVYHLARVQHWIQDRSIAPFATHYLPQVEFPPLDEYNLATLHLLAGTDRFDAAVALAATLVSVVGASELARMLGARRSGQIVASAVCVTIPTGILLATSTENDALAAAAGVGLLVVGLSLRLHRKWPWQAVALGASAGVAYLVKTTVVISFVPALALLLAVALYRHRQVGRDLLLRDGLRLAATAAVCGLAVVGPFVDQNFSLFRWPTGPATAELTSSPLTVEAGLANVVRTTANNFHIGNGQSGLNTAVSKVVLGTLHDAYDLFGVAPQDTRYSVTPSEDAFRVQNDGAFNRTEGGGANPWTVILLVASFAVLVLAAARGAASMRLPACLGAAFILGYVLFAFVDKWGLYDARYGLPLLVAWSPLIALALSRFPRWAGWAVVTALVLACVPQLVDASGRPLEKPPSYQASSLEPYFTTCCVAPATTAAAYENVTADLAESRCPRAALGNFVVDEYPLWVGLSRAGWSGVLDDTDVHNQTRKLEPRWTPCATITQQTALYRTPDDGTVNLDESGLVLSVDADMAATMRAVAPRFTSSSPGVRVWPGGGWLLGAFGNLPILEGSGSVYVTSASARVVVLELRLPASEADRVPAIVGPDGRTLPSRVDHGVVRAEVLVRPGTNRLRLLPSGTGGAERATALLDVSIEAG